MEGARVAEEIEKLEDTEQSDSKYNATEKPIPHWTEQLTFRGLVASFIIGTMYSIIIMKLNLTTGLSPTLNVSAALLSFFFLKAWTKILSQLGFKTAPFTKQENTVVQTCAVACYSISVAGGFGSYMLGLNRRTYEQTGVDTPGNVGYKNPTMGWFTGFLFSVCFVGLFSLIPLRKIMILDYKLPYPSGTATAVLINNFHTPQGNIAAKKQVRGFLKFFGISFLWSFFQWFFTNGDMCGFAQFPTFGLQARKQTFFFDFSLTYVGAGMIVSHLVNLSLLLGAIISWGITWPLLTNLKGDWYPAKLPESSMRSLAGYKAFLTIALILGDGLYNFTKIIIFTTKSLYDKSKAKKIKIVADEGNGHLIQGDEKHDAYFVKETIPLWVAYVGYIIFTIIAIIAIPLMFHQIKWYYVVIAYILAPVLGFSNAYGAGLTDINMAYNYGKVALFIFAAWSGRDSGVVAGLVACGLVKALVYISADLMHDFRTGYLTLTSPRSMVISQAIGTAMGCVIAPLSFFLFYKAFDIGNPNGIWKAPYALVYRNMAILGVEGFSALPKNCLSLCCGFFGFAVGVNVLRDFLPAKYGRWMPLPVAMAVPLIAGANFAIDMCVGSLIVFTWSKINSAKAKLMVPAVASGLLCGDGLWILPSALLALAKVHPPICMKFDKS
ncbi:YELLOW STRIPE like 3 [Rhynchospora pubera]|uniref:YELLOW STRIPE like 3 n=1 Tax=Rhynchospora pubera TaxID=906938 RepID=A0AAV8H702_9POAL|nr:YELLOW STRIPE like 3 [Rhynchospora pubera]